MSGNVQLRDREPCGEGGRSVQEFIWRAELRRFLLTGLLALLVALAPMPFLISAWSGAQALDHARQTTQQMADTVVAPLVTGRLLSGDPAALGNLSGRVRPWTDNGIAERVRIWNVDGRLIYACERAPAGSPAGPGPGKGPDKALPAAGGTSAVLALANTPATPSVAASGELLEVYVTTTTRTGSRLIVEAYYDITGMHTDWAAAALALAPGVLVIALVLPLSQLIAAARTARRTPLPSTPEVSELHRNLINDLAGLSYALEAEMRHSGAAESPLISRTRNMLREHVHAIQDFNQRQDRISG
jgi:two-component system NarL family sensor kinase